MLALVVLSGLTASTADAQLSRRADVVAPRPYVPPLVSRAPASPTGGDLADIRDRIADGRDEGSLSRRSARRLRREAGQVSVLAERYEAGGLSAAEQRELDVRARVLRDQVDVRRTQRATRRR